VVVGGGLSAGGIAQGAWQFVGYALGMGLVMTVLTVGTALFKGAVAAYLKRLLPWVERVSAVLIIAAGGYIIYYWLTIGRDLLLS
jgi:cytochrome c biogenesis protein CcdA